MLQPEAILHLLGIPFFYLCTLFFLRRRYSIPITASITLTCVLVSESVNIILFSIMEPSDDALLFFPLTVVLPAFGIFYLLSRQRGFAPFLASLFALSFYALADTVCNLLLLLPLGQLPQFLLSCAIYVLIAAVLFVLIRPAYFELTQYLKRSRYFFAAVPAIFYITLYLLHLFTDDPYELNAFLPFLIFLSAVLIFTYFIIYLLYWQMLQEQREKQSEQQLAYQTDLFKRSSAVQLRQESYQKNVRHYTRLIASHVKRGHSHQAMQAIGQLDRLNSKPEVHYCSSFTLNATLGYFTKRAESLGIHTKPRINCPAELSVDELELVVVLTNVLEHALCVLQVLPSGQKKELLISCSCTNQNVLWEISYSFSGTAQFDKRTGYPIHGDRTCRLAVQTLDTFARKYDALLDFSAENGLFHVRMLLES